MYDKYQATIVNALNDAASIKGFSHTEMMASGDQKNPVMTSLQRNKDNGSYNFGWKDKNNSTQQQSQLYDLEIISKEMGVNLNQLAQKKHITVEGNALIKGLSQSEAYTLIGKSIECSIARYKKQKDSEALGNNLGIDTIECGPA